MKMLGMGKGRTKEDLLEYSLNLFPLESSAERLNPRSVPFTPVRNISMSLTPSSVLWDAFSLRWKR
jgi:hypothetical protein